MKRIVLFWTGWVAIAAWVTLLDQSVLFVYIPYAMALAVAIGLLWLVGYGVPWRIKLTAYLVLAVWMLLVLPHIPWNERKEFFVDAWQVEAGMSLTEVDRIMEGHIKTAGGWAASVRVANRANLGEAIVYGHSLDCADWLVVYPDDNGVVGYVVISPD